MSGGFCCWYGLGALLNMDECEGVEKRLELSAGLGSRDGRLYVVKGLASRAFNLLRVIDGLGSLVLSDALLSR